MGRDDPLLNPPGKEETVTTVQGSVPLLSSRKRGARSENTVIGRVSRLSRRLEG